MPSKGGERTAGELEAEWESFEKLISSDAFAQMEEEPKSLPSGVSAPLPESFLPASIQPTKLPTFELAADAYERSLPFGTEAVGRTETDRCSQGSESDMDLCSNSSSQEVRGREEAKKKKVPTATLR